MSNGFLAAFDMIEAGEYSDLTQKLNGLTFRVLKVSYSLIHCFKRLPVAPPLRPL